MPSNCLQIHRNAAALEPIRGVVSSPIVRLAKDPSGRADGRKQPVELLDTYRCAKTSTESCGPARPRPAPVAREARSPYPSIRSRGK